jgi:ABC-type uncharacterized transport system substrate-binding protein
MGNGALAIGPKLPRPSSTLPFLGYVDGEKILIDVLSAGGKYDRFPALAAQCVCSKPEIIVAYTTPGAIAAKSATSNVTGQSLMAPEISSKRLQLLKEMVPTLSLVAVLSYLSDPIGALQVKEMEQAAGPLGLRLQIHDIKTTDDLSAAFEAATRAGAQAIVTTTETFLITRGAHIADLATKHRIPGMYPVRDFVDAGGLMSYGPSSLNLYRTTAVKVDKVLKGSKPADMPIEQPRKFEFTVSQGRKGIGIDCGDVEAHAPSDSRAGKWLRAVV